VIAIRGLFIGALYNIGQARAMIEGKGNREEVKGKDERLRAQVTGQRSKVRVND
jgi:hypothetical protein